MVARFVTLNGVCGFLHSDISVVFFFLEQKQLDPQVAIPKEKMIQGKKHPKKVFVGGLPLDLTVDELRSHFSQYGPITEALIMLDRHTNRPRGFGFIIFGMRSLMHLSSSFSILVHRMFCLISCHSQTAKWTPSVFAACATFS